MRPLVVELLAKDIEAPLLRGEAPAAGRVVSAFTVRCIRS
jgi:hypothetical protein